MDLYSYSRGLACCQHLQYELQEKGLDHEENFTKETLGFVIAAFIISSIIEMFYDLITGVTLAEMFTLKNIVIEIVCAILFAVVFTVVFKVLNLFPDKKKE